MLAFSVVLSGVGGSYFGGGGIKPMGCASRTGAVLSFALGGASVVELACGFSLVLAAAVVTGAGVGSLLGSLFGSTLGSVLRLFFGSFVGSFFGSTLGSLFGSAFAPSSFFASFAFGLLLSSSFFGALFGSDFSAGFLLSTLPAALVAVGTSSTGPTCPTDDCARTAATDRQQANAITARILLNMTLNFLSLSLHAT